MAHPPHGTVVDDADQAPQLDDGPVRDRRHDVWPESDLPLSQLDVVIRDDHDDTLERPTRSWRRLDEPPRQGELRQRASFGDLLVMGLTILVYAAIIGTCLGLASASVMVGLLFGIG